MRILGIAYRIGAIKDLGIPAAVFAVTGNNAIKGETSPVKYGTDVLLTVGGIKYAGAVVGRDTGPISSSWFNARNVNAVSAEKYQTMFTFVGNQMINNVQQVVTAKAQSVVNYVKSIWK
jgi:hypothetical protein